MRQPPAPIVCLIDSREQVPFVFPPTVKVAGRDVPVQTRTIHLRTGDYSIAGLEGCAAIERKSGADLLSSLSHERERFDREIERMALLRYKAIVCEAHLNELHDMSGVRTKAILGSIASFYARYQVPTFFVGSNVFGADITLGLLRRWVTVERARQSRFRLGRIAA